MRFGRPNPHRNATRLSPATQLSFFLVLLAPIATPSSPAQTSTPQPNQSTYTLHVYTDRVQIPTLVLTPTLEPLPLIPSNDFDISLDAGKHFHPTAVRLEGNDPIDLAILFDVSGSAYSLQSAFSQSILNFAANSLRPHDHISIYALDCTLIPAVNDLPASNGQVIATDLGAAIHSPELHGTGRKGPHCVNSVHLWSALAFLTKSLAPQPGRRVILAISDGEDGASPIKPQQLSDYAAALGVTIFGLSPPPLAIKQLQILRHMTDSFQNICELTGGAVLHTDPSELATSLNLFIDLVRGRYILEFPRPDKGRSGLHNIAVTLEKTDAFIRPGGITVPLPDPALLANPTTIPSPPSPAIFGAGHPPDPQP
jgi:hypothetical protein